MSNVQVKMTWTDLLLEANKLNRDDKLLLIKSLAGTAGMIACFPNQLVGSGAPTRASQQPKGQLPHAKKEKTGEQKSTNPLHGTEIAKAFQSAKKAVAAAKKAGSIDPTLLATLEEAKKVYFETLAQARVTKMGE
jgi:hypothetical protein